MYLVLSFMLPVPSGYALRVLLSWSEYVSKGVPVEVIAVEVS